MTIGGGIGSAVGMLLARIPGSYVDVRVAALVGMAALFAGASRALLASIVFAFETTRQPISLLPLLVGCTIAFFISSMRMPFSIMTLKIERRGTRVPGEYGADYLSRVLVSAACTRNVVTLHRDDLVGDVREWIVSHAEGSTHHGFPVLDKSENLIGFITRRDIVEAQDQSKSIGHMIHRAPAVVFEDNTLREAADHMVREGLGRLPVVHRRDPRKITGMISRADLLTAHQQRLQEEFTPTRSINPFERWREKQHVS
jgi:CBS domain-containing protein